MYTEDLKTLGNMGKVVLVLMGMTIALIILANALG
jgi:hypothetical protein